MDDRRCWHFGVNCRHLKRDEFAPADLRCGVAIERYSAPQFSFVAAKTPVPLDVAARFLSVSPSELVRRAKSGEIEWFVPDNVAKRVDIVTQPGKREVTIAEAAKRLQISLLEIERRIAQGEIEAYFPDRFMHIVLTTRWEYERCSLIDAGGICRFFEPHDGPQIRCLAESPLRKVVSDSPR